MAFSITGTRPLAAQLFELGTDATILQTLFRPFYSAFFIIERLYQTPTRIIGIKPNNVTALAGV
jgi:hypothetical protein